MFPSTNIINYTCKVVPLNIKLPSLTNFIASSTLETVTIGSNGTNIQ